MLAGTDPTKVAGRRIGAWFIDATIGGLFLLATILATFTTTEFDSPLTAELQCDVINEFSDEVCILSGSTVYLGTAADVGLLLVVWVGASVLLTMVIPAFTGWSPGKRLLGLRVVDNETFELAGAGPNLIRGLLWIVDGFGYVTGPLVGTIAMLSSDGSRRIGDMAAKTLVVRADHVGRPVGVRNVNTLGGATQSPVFVVGAPTSTSQPPPPSGPPVGSMSPPQSTPPNPGAPPVFPPPNPGAPPPPTGSLAAHQPPPPSDESSFDASPATTSGEAPLEEPAAVHEDAHEPEPPAQPEAQDTAPTMPPHPPVPAPRPGVDAPMWDDARDTYIQWDPELEEWMMWSETDSRWVPISR